MNIALFSIFGLSALTVMPISVPDPQETGNPASTCGAKITELEGEVENAVDSSKVVHFIESNTTAFKSLDQKYTLYWLKTEYRWDSDVSKCSAKLEGITASFQLATPALPFIGVAHITIDPRMDSVTSVQVDIPNYFVPK